MRGRCMCGFRFRETESVRSYTTGAALLSLTPLFVCHGRPPAFVNNVNNSAGSDLQSRGLVSLLVLLAYSSFVN